MVREGKLRAGGAGFVESFFRGRGVVTVKKNFQINLWPLPLQRGALRLWLPTGARGVNAERKEAGDRLRHPRPSQPAPGPQPLPPRAAAVAAPALPR